MRIRDGVNYTNISLSLMFVSSQLQNILVRVLVVFLVGAQLTMADQADQTSRPPPTVCITTMDNRIHICSSSTSHILQSNGRAVGLL